MQVRAGRWWIGSSYREGVVVITVKLVVECASMGYGAARKMWWDQITTLVC